jgi:tagatose 1,6-diphosphate aldolase
MSVKISQSKIEHMKMLSNEHGVISAAAMDQRGSLKKSIAAGKGIGPADVTDEMMTEFKVAVSRVLTKHASAILLDPQWGMPAAAARAAGSGLLLSYEASGYDNTRPGRQPDLLPDMSVRRIKEAGANAIKVLIYYTPFDSKEINDEKHAFIERIGDECHTNGIPLFLEFIGYDPKGGDEKGFEFAKIKPEVVTESMREFSKDRYGVDVLKVEIPINLTYAEGALAFKGEKAYDKAEVLQHFRNAAEVAKRPFIYLSAGVSNPEFTEALDWATEAGVAFSGVLCGRATWKEGIPVYAEKGAAALEEWLLDEGVRNINAVNNAITKCAAWYSFYGASSADELAG